MTVTDSDLLHAARALRVDLLNELGRSNEISELEPVEEIVRAKESASRLRAKERAAAKESAFDARPLDSLRKIFGNKKSGDSTIAIPGLSYIKGVSRVGFTRITGVDLVHPNQEFVVEDKVQPMIRTSDHDRIKGRIDKKP